MIKKRLQHRCLPVKFVKFLRTTILKNICKRLLLPVSVSRLSVTMAAYLDNCTNISHSVRLYWENTLTLMKIFQSLDFTVHAEPKCSFLTSQKYSWQSH